MTPDMERAVEGFLSAYTMSASAKKDLLALLAKERETDSATAMEAVRLGQRISEIEKEGSVGKLENLKTWAHWKRLEIDRLAAQRLIDPESIQGSERDLLEAVEHAMRRLLKAETALKKLRDCDFVITPADRMDTVRAIAREGLEDGGAAEFNSYPCSKQALSKHAEIAANEARQTTFGSQESGTRIEGKSGFPTEIER